MIRVVSVWHGDTGRSRWYVMPDDGTTRALGPFDTKAVALAASRETGPADAEPLTNEQAGQTYSLF